MYKIIRTEILDLKSPIVVGGTVNFKALSWLAPISLMC
jgi:hypothetical protein